MSAWIVDQAHIDVLVNAAAQFGVLGAGTNWTETGRALWEENRKSVAYRYPRDTPDELPGPIFNGGIDAAFAAYRFEPTEASLDPVVVKVAASCFGYQSCEHPQWREDDNPVRRLVERIEDEAEKRSEGRGRTDLRGWGISKIEEAFA